jgi:4-amino-4-deoxy-L-arabinose transferase-like glycosyltransferase
MASLTLTKNLSILIFTTFFTSLLVIGLQRNAPQFSDSLGQQSSDAINYVRLARNIQNLGAYTREKNGEGEPDFLRTPGYPLFIIATFSTNHPIGLYAAQAILVIASITLIYRTCLRSFGYRAALIASLFTGTDLLLLTSTLEAMSEILFLALTLQGLHFLGCLDASKAGLGSNRNYFIGGCVIGLSTLVRPANQYLPVITTVSLFISLAGTTNIKNLLKITLAVWTGFLLTVTPWIVRNYNQFGVAKLTNIDKHNLAYYVGVGALRAEHGWSKQEAREFIQQKYNIPDYRTLQNPWVSQEKNTKELYDCISPVATQIATENIPMLVKSSAIGIIKASLSHSAVAVGQITGGQWSSTRDLANCSPHLILAFSFQMLHTVAYLFAAFFGMATLIFTCGRRKVALIFLLLLGYYYLIVAMFGIDGFARARISCLPFLFILAGVGIDSILTKVGYPCKIKETISGRSAPEKLIQVL